MESLRIKIETILTLLLVLIFSNNLIDYELITQHDAALHHYPIFNLLTFNFIVSTPYGIFSSLYIILCTYSYHSIN